MSNLVILTARVVLESCSSKLGYTDKLLSGERLDQGQVDELVSFATYVLSVGYQGIFPTDRELRLTTQERLDILAEVRRTLRQ